MPFDPNLPQAGTPADADQMRAQLTGLKDLIDALPSLSGAVVDAVSTLNPGDAATVNLSVNSGTLHLSFGIPRGTPGAQGPPFANAVVDGVTTLNPGDAATAQTSFDGSNVHFQFGIPRGSDGQNGVPVTSFVVDAVNTLPPGSNATVQASFDGTSVRFTFGIPQGNDGGPGPTGEVSNAALSSAISGTSSNSNGVNPLGLNVSDPPTQGEMQAIANKLDELIAALRR